MENKKMHGLYPGSLKDIDKINNLSELDLFLYIDELSHWIWETGNAMCEGKLPWLDQTEDKYALDYLIYQTRRFGVTIPAPERQDEKLDISSYMEWYEYYLDHFKRNLSEDQYNEFLTLKKEGKDYSEYLPAKTWSETLYDNNRAYTKKMSYK